MRLNKDNAKYAVVQWAMWNGGVVSYHNSLSQAIKKANAYNKSPNANGYEVCRVFPITKEAQDEIDRMYSMRERFYAPLDSELNRLVSNLPYYDGSQKYNEFCL